MGVFTTQMWRPKTGGRISNYLLTFQNLEKEFFTSCWGKVCDRLPLTEMVMQPCMQHVVTSQQCPSKGGTTMWRYFTCCIARYDIRCDEDERVWACQRGMSGCAWMICSTMYVVCSFPIRTTILSGCAQLYPRSFFLHNIANNLELQRAFVVKNFKQMYQV